jgi:MFS family permease
MRSEQNAVHQLSGIKNIFLNSLKGDPLQQDASRSRMRIAISAFYFSMGFCFASWASRIPDFKTSLHLSVAELGTILLALPLGQLITMPVSGRLVTRYGSRSVLSIAILFYAFQLTNIGWASNGWQLGLSLFLFGVVGNMSNISVNTQGVLAENIYKRSIMTSFHGVWSVAGFTGGLVGLLMMNLRLTPREHFIIVASFVLVIVLIARRYLIPGTSAPAEKKKLFSKPDRVLVQLGIIAFCCMAAEGTMFEWSGVYFKEIVKAPPSLIVLGYISFMVMMATGRFMGDKIICRIGRKKTIQLGGVLITTGLLVSVLFPYLVTATIGFLIVGIGVSSIVPTVYSTAARSSRIAPGMALATVSSISFLGFLVGPPIIGYIAYLSSLRYSFAFIALLGIGISLIVSRLKVMD